MVTVSHCGSAVCCVDSGLSRQSLGAWFLLVEGSAAESGKSKVQREPGGGTRWIWVKRCLLGVPSGDSCMLDGRFS